MLNNLANLIAYQFPQSKNHLQKTVSIQIHPFSPKNLLNILGKYFICV